MKSFFKNVLSSLVGMVLAVIVITLLFIGIISLSISSVNNNDKVIVKKNSILEINLSDLSVVERIAENPLGNLNISGDIPKTISLKQVLDNIEKAKNDQNIKAIYINTSFVNAGISQIEEMEKNKLMYSVKNNQLKLEWNNLFDNNKTREILERDNFLFAN